MSNPPLAEVPARPRPPNGAVAAVVLAAVATVGAALSLASWLDDGRLVFRAASFALLGGGALLWLAARELSAPKFGAANAVTLARAALAVLLAALVGAATTPAVGWLLVGLGAAVVALDGADGALARRRREASEFGARFDMETDAFLILVLAALVWQHGKAGAWILAAGLVRYAFVAASYAWPWLGAPLPASRRRQAVCVVQIVSLLGALLPVVPLPWSGVLAFVGLAALLWSFAVDARWLARFARS